MMDGIALSIVPSNRIIEVLTEEEGVAIVYDLIDKLVSDNDVADSCYSVFDYDTTAHGVIRVECVFVLDKNRTSALSWLGVDGEVGTMIPVLLKSINESGMIVQMDGDYFDEMLAHLNPNPRNEDSHS